MIVCGTKSIKVCLNGDPSHCISGITGTQFYEHKVGVIDKKTIKSSRWLIDFGYVCTSFWSSVCGPTMHHNARCDVVNSLRHET